MEVNNSYFINKVQPIFKSLLADIIEDRPENVYQYIIDKCSLKLDNKSVNSKATTQNSLSNSEEDEDLIDDLELFQKQKQNLINKKKISISAEVFGDHNKLEDIQIVNHKKSKLEEIGLANLMSKSFMFNTLTESDFKKVLNAFEIILFNEDETVIKEGDSGDKLFMVKNGILDCYKILNDKNTYLKSYIEGDTFGELALLYNVPRQASIYAKTAASLYSLDRTTFNYIVKNASIKNRERYIRILENIELFKVLNKIEIDKIADCLTVKKYNKGSKVIEKGDIGNSFFIITSGNLKAVKDDLIVFEYNNEGYFGELSLINNEPRACDIIVESDIAEIIEFDKVAFESILGSLNNILKRNIDMYQKFIPKKNN